MLKPFSFLVQRDALELPLRFKNLSVSVFLLAVDAEHEQNKCKKHSKSDHEEHESLVVQVIRSKRRHDFKLVADVIVRLLRRQIGERVDPGSVIENNEYVVMDLVGRKECIVCAAPLRDLLSDYIRVRSKRTGLGFLVMLPQSASLDVAIVVLFTSENEHIKFVISQKTEPGIRLLTLNFD